MLKLFILIIIFSLLLIPVFSQSFAQDVVLRHHSDPVLSIETNFGNLVIDFFPYDAPNHVKNFITLSESGFYDGTLFHRVIPGFMIQGGDPNTINGDSSTWGQGGPTERIDAEFNTIKHDRGIVSMARSADPNSAGSQFFIVHQNSNFLDGEYTAFGRLVTEESFETLDKIAAVQTGDRDIPINTEQIKIIRVTLDPRSMHPNLLELGEPSRTGAATITESFGSQIFENIDLGIKFSAPEGWLLQQSKNKSNPSSPDVVAVGPKIDKINPYISVTIRDAENQTIDDLILLKNDNLSEVIELNQVEIISQSKIKTNVHQMTVVQNLLVNNESILVQIQDVMILVNQKIYTLTYANSVNNFENDILKFNDTLNSFELIAEDSSLLKISEDETILTIQESSEEGGGCLIATATYGSEFAPQVQQLREIRDNQLMNTESGSAFMSGFNELYYTFSPTIADYERENLYFKEAVKLTITPMLSTLAIMENAESESEVLGLGLSVIVLNLGMYLGIPAIVVIGIKRKF
jgi:peptidyl-prolyl cis-trans isomerase B (cyclophilin B)